VFVAILLVGYAYAYGKGALDWDERTEEQPAPASIWRRRPPIRFGNETSGPVRIVHRQEQPDTGDARADQDAAVHGAAAAGTR
jgi:hypothetical protein